MRGIGKRYTLGPCKISYYTVALPSNNMRNFDTSTMVPHLGFVRARVVASNNNGNECMNQSGRCKRWFGQMNANDPMRWGKTSNIMAQIDRSSTWPIRIEEGHSETFGIVYIGLFELCTRPLDIHSCELLGVCWPRERESRSSIDSRVFLEGPVAVWH